MRMYVAKSTVLGIFSRFILLKACTQLGRKFSLPQLKMTMESGSINFDQWTIIQYKAVSK